MPKEEKNALSCFFLISLHEVMRQLVEKVNLKRNNVHVLECVSKV